LNHCPRCGEEVSPGQEYCVECGLRLPGPDAVGTTRDPGSGWIRRSLVGLAVAVAGGFAAVAATGGSSDANKILTATGGFATTPAGSGPVEPEVTPKRIVDWPVGQEGWTITLASLPQTGGRQAAVERAGEARKRALPTVGILDSSRYASLHPGYWVVFSGVYSSEAEATSALEQARAFTRTASVRRIVP
jgi:zinc-ribbon domain